MVFPKIVTISGIDGAGKTTLANLVKCSLERKGYVVRVVHIGGGFAYSSEVKQPISSSLGIAIYFKDYIQVLFHYIRSLGKYDVIIFDRFLYDTLVKIAYKEGQMRLPSFPIFPLPHRAFHLLLPETTARKRDPQHSPMYHAAKHLLYRELDNKFSLVPIDATQTKNKVLEAMSRLF